jgi:quinolinate synthase
MPPMPIVEKTVEATYQRMRERLEGIVPDFELHHKAQLVFDINRLKAERGAVILGHNYMEPALFHTVPDFVGDSLELSRRAAETSADPIVFCGVRFMAETAKILNPARTVLLPAKVAGCSLAAAITAGDVRELRRRFPGVPVVSYINTYADVKAESDIICTSGNAVAVVESLKSDTVLFLPDEFLAANVARETGRTILYPTKEPVARDRRDRALEYVMLGWTGRCEVHEKFTVEDIAAVRAQFPDVFILAHPECSPEVVAAADYSGSTTAMARAVCESRAARYLLLTECSMADNIAAENRDKEMLRLCSARCPHMNEITLEDTLDALRFDRQVIDVPAEIRVRARRAIDRMLAVGTPAAAQD